MSNKKKVISIKDVENKKKFRAIPPKILPNALKPKDDLNIESKNEEE